MAEENVGTPMGEEEVSEHVTEPAAEEVTEPAEEVKEPVAEEVSGQITDDDKLWGLLSWFPWVGWILAIIALLIEPQKDRPFVRYHAIQSLVANVILTVVSIILGITVILSCIAPFLWVILIWPAIKAYQGEWLEIPFVTEFCKNQGWI